MLTETGLKHDIFFVGKEASEKLDESQSSCKLDYPQGFTYQFVANEYGVNATTISRLRNKFIESGSVGLLVDGLVEVRRGNQHQTKEDMLMVRQLKKDIKTGSH